MRKQLSFIVMLLTMTFISKADNYIESFNVISDGYTEDVQDVQIIRPINGGTVITPVFDASCPEAMKAPFAYACKIVEEYMPPCLPLKVRVSCENINGTGANTISRVRASGKENFGYTPRYYNVQMSTIKGVILAEKYHNSTITYLDSIPNIGFLTDNPDIEITYNTKKLNELSFSLDINPGNNYDFASLAVRDILIGLGFSSGYRYDANANELLNPIHIATPFESIINRTLGNYGNPSARLAQATKGELLLKLSATQNLKLYAPNPWQNGLSLNNFIPQDDCSVTNVLSYNFCKGMVARSLSDSYASLIFRELLGWDANYVTGSTSTVTSAGSTSLMMPYNGSISFDNDTYGITNVVSEGTRTKSSKTFSNSSREELLNYIDLFFP